jgi:hypothetical protein
MSDQTPIERDDDRVPPRMKSAFVQIILIETAILGALWVLGRMFS